MKFYLFLDVFNLLLAEKYIFAGKIYVMSEEKIKKKLNDLYFFLVGPDSSSSEESSTGEYSVCALRDYDNNDILGAPAQSGMPSDTFRVPMKQRPFEIKMNCPQWTACFTKGMQNCTFSTSSTLPMGFPKHRH